MANKVYRLRYLPIFMEDLAGAADYIANVLNNKSAALRLIDEAEAAIKERLSCPESFEPYPSIKRRELPYYRIYVKNYTVFYVATGDVMEVRRFVYRGRDAERHI